MINKSQLSKILIKASIINNPKEFDDLFKDCPPGIAPEKYLMDKKIISERMIYELLADILKLKFVNLEEKDIAKEILFLVPEPIAQTHKIIAFEATDKSVSIATSNPDDLQTIEFVKRKLSKPTEVFITNPGSIKEVLKQYHQSLTDTFEELVKSELKKYPEEAGEQNLTELSQHLPVIRIVDSILEYAVFKKASDIHIEPKEKEVSIRYRIDGILHEIMTLPKNTQPGIVARIKVLSNLKLDEHRLPQDGRFKTQTDKYKVAFRVSVIPVYDGEKIVLRLLDEGGQILTLEQLGFQPYDLKKVQRNIERSHGMLLVTGPTGSGKTTTLYTIMNILNTPEVNIATVEDPIEYKMANVNQSQVAPKIGFTFASGLRSLLRQDPNIIMVGEIRDNETADIAVNAALTGHLVLSTLHTNDAPSSLLRLGDMGVPRFLIASVMNLIIAQRLARRICQNCIQTQTLKPEELEEIKAQLKLDVDELNLLGSNKDGQQLSSLTFYKGGGCKQCDGLGYRGRVGLYEVLEVTPTISDLIVKNASVADITQEAKKEGMKSMFHDGLLKAQQGQTTIEELLRVIRE